MIYHCYLEGLSRKYEVHPHHFKETPEHRRKLHGKDMQALLVRHIKETSGNQYVFITTTSQAKTWSEFLREHDLKDYVSYTMPRPITNGNYLEQGRKLFLHVLKSKVDG